MQARIEAAFKELDTSGDGFIDAKELIVVGSAAHAANALNSECFAHNECFAHRV